MEKKTVQYMIPDGFRIYEREEKMTVSDVGAVDLLLPMRRRATSAHRDGDAFTIKNHRVECLFCRRQLPWRHSKTSLETQSLPSIPMLHEKSGIEECTINSYSFEWLKSNREFSNVGEKMNNCLRKWSPYDNPVIVAKKGHCPVAAIEIDVELESVIQAMLSDNVPIYYNDDFMAAFVKFKDRFGLHVSQHILQGDYEEEF